MSRVTSGRVRTTQLSVVAVHRSLTLEEKLCLGQEISKVLSADSYGPVLVGMLTAKSLRILSPQPLDPDTLGTAIITAGLLPLIAGPMSHVVRTQ